MAERTDVHVQHTFEVHARTPFAVIVDVARIPALHTTLPPHPGEVVAA